MLSSSTFYYETDHRKCEIMFGGWHCGLRLFILRRPHTMGFEPRSPAWLASTGQSATTYTTVAVLVGEGVAWETPRPAPVPTARHNTCVWVTSGHLPHWWGSWVAWEIPRPAPRLRLSWGLPGGWGYSVAAPTPPQPRSARYRGCPGAYPTSST